MKVITDNKELVKALKIIWILSVVLSVVLLLVLVGIPERQLYEIIPKCSAKTIQQECILCGCSRAYFALVDFRFQEAYTLNKLSPFLFLGMLTNILLLLSNLKKINRL